MSKENVDLVRKQLEALDRRDLDGVMNSVAEDTVLDSRPELTRARPAFEPEVVRPERWPRNPTLWRELLLGSLRGHADIGPGVPSEDAARRV